VLALERAGVLHGAAAAEAAKSLAAHRRAFAEGMAVIEAHGLLTERGRAILAGARAHMAAFAAARPLRYAPDTVFEYSSGTSLLLSRIVRQTIGDQAAYWAFPRRALFNRIGMRGAIFQPDASGTFVGSSYVYATARDWARFGLLYLNDGVWEGEKILPEGWVDYTRTPSPTAGNGEYGAHFRLNGAAVALPEKRMFPRLPPDAFFCRGYQGQLTAIIPSRRLVAVRLGLTWDSEWGGDDFLAAVLAAVEPSSAGTADRQTLIKENPGR